MWYNFIWLLFNFSCIHYAEEYINYEYCHCHLFHLNLCSGSFRAGCQSWDIRACYAHFHWKRPKLRHWSSMENLWSVLYSFLTIFLMRWGRCSWVMHKRHGKRTYVPLSLCAHFKTKCCEAFFFLQTPAVDSHFGAHCHCMPDHVNETLTVWSLIAVVVKTV